MWLQCNTRSHRLTCPPAGPWSWQGGTCPNGQILNGLLPPGECRHRRRLSHLALYFVVIQRNVSNVAVADLAYEIMEILLGREPVQGEEDCVDLPAEQILLHECDLKVFVKTLISSIK